MRQISRYFSLCSIFLFVLLGCNDNSNKTSNTEQSKATEGSKVKGKVVNTLTNQPISEVTVTATTHIDVEEDKKYEKVVGKTDDKGEFLLAGLSPQYYYKITASKEGYFEDSRDRVELAEKGKTKVLENPLKILLSPPGYGVYLYSNEKFFKIEPTTGFKRYNYGYNYFNLIEMSNSPTKIAKTLTQNDRIFVYLSEVDNRSSQYITNLSHFSSLAPYSHVRDESVKNVLILGGCRTSTGEISKQQWRLNSGNKFQNPTGSQVQGWFYGDVPCSSYNANQRQLLVIDINQLEKGNYAFVDDMQAYQGGGINIWLFEFEEKDPQNICLKNLQTLHKACALYQKDKGMGLKYPKSIEEIYENKLIEANFICPLYPEADSKGKKFRCDYCYLYYKMGASFGPQARKWILAYCAQHNNQVPVLFADGYTETMSKESFVKLYEAQVERMKQTPNFQGAVEYNKGLTGPAW